MYFSIKIDSADPRVEKYIFDCASLEDVNKFLRKHISFTQPRNWMNELDRDITQIEDTDMRHNDRVRNDIVNNLLKPDCREIHIIDNCFIFGSSPCKLKIKKVNQYGKGADHVTVDDVDLKFAKYIKQDMKKLAKQMDQEVYRTFQVTPERVIYNDPATIVFWKDGTKTVVKCMEGDTYDPEVGLAMCVCKKLYGSKYHKFFRYYAPKKPEVKENKKQKSASLDDAYDKFSEMVKEALEKDKSFLEKFASQLFGEKENLK